jgi:mono/diheme cytochrome c family protein
MRALISCSILALAAGACASPAKDASSTARPATTVDWNPGKADVGRVLAVTELGDEVTVFSQAGVYVFVSGSLAGSITSSPPIRWAGAATIPESGNGSGRWVVGFDETGALWRVRDRARLERVDERFALAQKPVIAVFEASSTPRLATFVQGDRLAVADGSMVRFVGAHANGAAGGGGTIALREADHVTKLEADLHRATGYRLEGASDVAVDAHGRVFASRDDAVYAEQGGALTLVRQARGPVRTLAAAADRVWWSEGGHLVTAEPNGGAVRIAEVGAPALGPHARLFGSPSGDVWVVDDGRLARYSLSPSPSPSAAAPHEPDDAASWQATVRPIFLRVCGSCHAPGGSSGVDLSSLAAWRSARGEIRSRVVTDKTMPPPGAPHPLTEADRAALAGWLR